MIVLTTISWIRLNKRSTSIVSERCDVAFKFLRYSLKALSVHFDLVTFVLLSNSDRESIILPGRMNGFGSPVSTFYKVPELEICVE